jgi:hypothetical protein
VFGVLTLPREGKYRPVSCQVGPRMCDPFLFFVCLANRDCVTVPGVPARLLFARDSSGLLGSTFSGLYLNSVKREVAPPFPFLRPVDSSR